MSVPGEKKYGDDSTCFATEARLTVYTSKSCCVVRLDVGVEGWCVRTPKWFIAPPWTPYWSREEGQMLALWAALTMCERMGWTPLRPKWFDVVPTEGGKTCLVKT